MGLLAAAARAGALAAATADAAAAGPLASEAAACATAAEAAGAVAAAKLAGKGVGAAYDAISDDKPDNSGISIKYRESDPRHPYQPSPGASNSRPPEEALP